MRTVVLTLATALLLGACAPLTSEHPLFAVDEHTGPPPLTEGVWVAISDHCTRAMATTTPLPDGCDPLTVHHTRGAGWTVTGSGKDDNGNPRTETINLIIVPAVQRDNPDAYAPLYIVQMSPREADMDDTHYGADARIYGVLAAIGTLPATEVFFTDIGCGAVLREGRVDGITPRYDDGGHVTGCMAANQDAAREAARRALIEELGDVDQNRLIFLHP